MEHFSKRSEHFCSFLRLRLGDSTLCWKSVWRPRTKTLLFWTSKATVFTFHGLINCWLASLSSWCDRSCVDNCWILCGRRPTMSWLTSGTKHFGRSVVSDRPVQQAMVSGLREVIERCLTKQWPSFESKHGGKTAVGKRKAFYLLHFRQSRHSSACTCPRLQMRPPTIP